MNAKQKEQEFEVLSYAGIPSIPESLNDEMPVWVKAVAKVRNRNGGISYAIVSHVYGGNPKYIKTFDSSGIAKLISIHPYEFLNSGAIPEFPNITKLRAFLAKAYHVPIPKVAKLDQDNLKKLLINYCIEKQLEKSRQEAEAIERIENKRIAEAEAEAEAVRKHFNENDNE